MDSIYPDWTYNLLRWPCRTFVVQLKSRTEKKHVLTVYGIYEKRWQINIFRPGQLWGNHKNSSLTVPKEKMNRVSISPRWTREIKLTTYTAPDGTRSILIVFWTPSNEKMYTYLIFFHQGKKNKHRKTHLFHSDSLVSIWLMHGYLFAI